MKCPYRIKTITQTDNPYPNDITTSEEFEECYGTECPWYYAGISNIDGKEYELCEKVESDK